VPIILIALKDDSENLRLLVDPKWRTIVQKEDLEYIGSLLTDFPNRAQLDSLALFKQLCLLDVGPLVTQKTGTNISRHPVLSELCSGFVQL
jgi:hypothetical protein